jgi:HTH-type transcriptional repressor of NAD biosynthesis genes
VTDIDVPWVDDNQRFFKDERQEFIELCLQALRPYLMISGNWEERFARARQAVENLRGT